MSLRDILDAATPGPWHAREVQHHWNDYSYNVDVPKTAANARLGALAPELAALCLDMGDYLRDQGATRYGDEPADVLLARLAALTRERDEA